MPNNIKRALNHRHLSSRGRWCDQQWCGKPAPQSQRSSHRPGVTAVAAGWRPIRRFASPSPTGSLQPLLAGSGTGCVAKLLRNKRVRRLNIARKPSKMMTTDTTKGQKIQDENENHGLAVTNQSIKIKCPQTTRQERSPDYKTNQKENPNHS